MHPFKRYRDILAEYGLKHWEGSTPGWVFTNWGERRLRAKLDSISYITDQFARDLDTTD